MTRPGGLPPAGLVDLLAHPPPVPSDPLAPADNASIILSPTLERPTPLPANNLADPLAALLQPSLPSAASQPTILTPGTDALSLANQPSMDMVVGACIAPVLTSDPRPPPAPLSSKNHVGLRLPSFEALGIANPHSQPDLPSPGTLPVVLETVPLGALAQAAGVADPRTSPVRLGSTHFETLTPPEEKNAFWMPAVPLPDLAIPITVAAPSEHPLPRLVMPPETMTPISIASDGTTSAPRGSVSSSASTFWLQDVIDDMVSNLLSTHSMQDSIKLMSQALPCPSPSGFAFPRVISTLQQRTAGHPLCWINVFHALPAKFGLNDVPTSPPATPDPPASEAGRDYFTSMTFDSAVRVLDYQDNITSMPRSPHPLVPPSTVGLSIVERYIPPTNRNEFSGMFALGGRSLLIDRLVELSVHNGSLLLIYPTKAGAETFTRHYLGPVLDPLLRSMRTIHHLPVELVESLGKMSAVDSMLDFDALSSRISALCAALSSTSDPHIGRFAGGARTSRFVLDAAAAHRVTPDRDVWARAWWAKQEKPRVRDTVKRFARWHQSQSAEGAHVTPTAIVETVLDGVASRPYPPDAAPAEPIEVGVFVIRRTAVEE